MSKLCPSEISRVKPTWISPGGSDTTVAAVGGFILAMLMNPDVQAKAYSELEKVLGPGDLPRFSDEPSLPYITAIVREVLRHNPVTPLGAYQGHIPRLVYTETPHRSQRSTIYSPKMTSTKDISFPKGPWLCQTSGKGVVS